MKNRLDRDTITFALSQDVVPPGFQTHWNHLNCPAGEDTKGRLYCKRTDDGKMLLLHCFNCGGSAAVRYPGTTFVHPSSSYVPKPAGSKREIEAFEHTKDLFAKSKRLGPNTWPMQYFIKDDFARNLFHSNFDELFRAPDLTSVMLLRGDKHNVTGYDIRYWPKAFKRIIAPEYAASSKLLTYNLTGSTTAVVVEDPISAMKVSMSGYAGVALCGSHLSEEDALKLVMLYNNVIVWLDNDSADIVRQAMLARDRLALYTSDVRMVRNPVEPKKLTLSMIENEIAKAC